MTRHAGSRLGSRSRRARRHEADTDSLDADSFVVQFRSGDRAAFAGLVRLTTPATYTLALRLVADPDDARDVVQETYLRAYRGLRSFRGDASVTSWLHRITTNCALDLLARRTRHRHDDLDCAADLVDTHAETDPVLSTDAALLRDHLSAALVGLPDTLRSVIVLRDIYELSHAELARRLDITEAAAKVRLHRARVELRRRLGPMSAGERRAV